MWDTLGRVDNGVAPGKSYRKILSCFSIMRSKFPLTYHDELIDEGSVRSVWEGGKRFTYYYNTFYTGHMYNPVTQPYT